MICISILMQIVPSLLFANKLNARSVVTVDVKPGSHTCISPTSATFNV